MMGYALRANPSYVFWERIRKVQASPDFISR